MPIIIDQFEDTKRTVVFDISSIGSIPLSLGLNDSVNYLIQSSEAFSLQRPYKILETKFEKKINSLVLSDGTNTINFSESMHEETDEIRILPDYAQPIKNSIWNVFKSVKLEPSEIHVGTRIRSSKLSILGLLANPTLSWNINFQVSFVFE